MSKLTYKSGSVKLTFNGVALDAIGHVEIEDGEPPPPRASASRSGTIEMTMTRSGTIEMTMTRVANCAGCGYMYSGNWRDRAWWPVISQHYEARDLRTGRHRYDAMWYERAPYLSADQLPSACETVQDGMSICARCAFSTLRRDCADCGGSGMAPYYVRRQLPRPSSRIVLVGRWTDPRDGVTHARIMSNRQRSQGMRPSCGAGGMFAVLRRHEWNYRERITCDECFEIAERALLRQAGDKPLTDRIPRRLQRDWRWNGRPIRIRITREDWVQPGHKTVEGFRIEWSRWFNHPREWRYWRAYSGTGTLREVIRRYRSYAAEWRGFE